MSPQGGTQAMRSNGRRTMLLLFLVCLAPVVASYFTFYVLKPERRANYGELLATPVAFWTPAEADPALRGKWVLVVGAEAACDAQCRQQLWVTRQVRTAQAKESDRVARLWLQSGVGVADAGLLAEHPGLVLQRADARMASLGDRGIGLVDPHGKLILRFPAEPDAKRMIKDLQRLLKYVQAG